MKFDKCTWQLIDLDMSNFEFEMFVVAGAVKKGKTNAQNLKLNKFKLMSYKGKKLGPPK